MGFCKPVLTPITDSRCDNSSNYPWTRPMIIKNYNRHKGRF